MKPMSLADYLDMFSWSQAELARQAGVSTHCVSRAINGAKIARRNANKIIAALDLQFQKQGPKAHITMISVKGLQLADLQRKPQRRRQAKDITIDPPDEDPPDEEERQS